VFHNWASTGGETVTIDEDTQLAEVRCYQCGLIAPEWQTGAPHFVSVSHSALGVWCDGARHEGDAHHFAATGGEDDPIRCEWCGLELGEGDASPVDWDCHGQER